MLRYGRAVTALLLCAGFTTAVRAAEPPVAVSPGDSSKLAVIADRCPTFSWGEAEGARSYELVVYRLGEDGEEPLEMLRRSFSGSVYTWTPSLASCLERGGQYAWSVRAVGRKEPSDWSAPSLFEVASGPSEAEVEAALRVVRQYLVTLGGVESEGVAAHEAVSTSQPSVEPAVALQAPDSFNCSNAKPLDVLTMVWDGSQQVRIKAWKGSVGSTLLADRDEIAPGGVPGTTSEVAITGYAGSPNDVIWEVFLAGTSTKLGESKFHLSCSDDEMNGPEDCRLNQGNGKGNEAGLINDWLLEGLAGNGVTLDCTPMPEPPVPTQLSVDGGVIAKSFTGDGSTLTNLAPTNLSVAVPVSKGGTGAWDAAGARTNLDVVAGPHTVDTDTDDQTLAEVLAVGNDAGGSSILGVGTLGVTAVDLTGYLQLATVMSAPPASECDEAQEEGRAKFNPVLDVLYLCSGASGWITK